MANDVTLHQFCCRGKVLSCLICIDSVYDIGLRGLMSAGRRAIMLYIAKVIVKMADIVMLGAPCCLLIKRPCKANRPFLV